MLDEQIRKLTENKIPMHMPGHKRNLRPVPGLPYGIDITEIDGADDLHAAEGILCEAMKRTAGLYGSRRTWYLVGGSTAGILAGIRAAIPWGSEIIAARGCHRSVCHAIELSGFKVNWIYPQQDPVYGFPLSISPEEIRQCLRRHPNTAGVVITSPTYEGILSDVRRIAAICHRAEIPLIVDEAHGAHLGLFEEGGFARGAVLQGADLVVQSAHKTLPALTQTGFLHLSGNCIDEREVERQLGIFETSSPSYPLMASLDGCTELLLKEGRGLFADWGARLDRFAQATEGLRCIEIFDRSLRGRRDVFELDRSKIVIGFGGSGLNGAEAAKILRTAYGIETEMSGPEYVLAMTGCGDSDENLEKLAGALRELDRKLWEKQSTEEGSSAADAPSWKPVPASGAALTAFEASLQPWSEVPLEESADRISAEYLYAYPPGIPFLVPGEYITQEHIDYLTELERCGVRVHHSRGCESGLIACLCE